MSDIASLGIRVTTSGVNEASASLDKLTASGAAASKSTADLNRSFSQGGGIARPAKEASDAIKEQTAALAKLAGQIDPTVAKLEKLDALQAQLASFKGKIDPADYKALNDALAATRSKIGGASEAMHAFTLNNANARRELGYMAKDIATGQWGRLEQSFSTLAVRSGALNLLLSPLGAALAAGAAAAGLFAVGAFKGAEESEKLRVSVIATGQAAGVSGAGFRDIAQSIGAATGKYGDATAAINVFARSTKTAGQSIQTLGQLAVNMATVTGESVSQAAQDILALGNDPANAVVKLNDKYNILTSSQYAYISALQEAGNTEQATATAQGIAAQAFKQRAQDVEDGSGFIIRAAHAVGSAWDSAWNSIKGLGATKGPGEQLKDVNSQIETLKEQYGISDKDNLLLAPLIKKQSELRAQLVTDGFKATQAAIDNYANQQSIAAQQRLSQFKPPKEELDSQLAKANKDRLAALYGIVDQKTIDKINAEYAQQVDKAVEAYNSATKQRIAKGRAPSKADPFASLNSLVQKAQVFDNGIGEPKQDTQQVTAILAIADAGAKLIKSGQDVAKVQALVAKGVAALNEGYAKQAAILKGENAAAIAQYQASLDKQNASLRQSIDAQVAQITMGSKEAQQMQQMANLTRQNAEALTELQLKRAAVKAKGGDTTVLDADIASLKANMDKQVQIMTGGWKEIAAAEANGLNGVHTAIANFMAENQNNAQIMQQFTTNLFSGFSDAFASFVSGTESAKKAFGSFIDSMYQQALKFLANKAIQALFDSFGNGSSETPGSTNGGFSSLLGNFFNDSRMWGGSSGGGSSGSSAEASVSQAIFGDSGFSNSGASAGGGFWSSILSLFTSNAMGGVYNSPSLSAYSGRVVSKPTLFKFAHGMGLMGEAGDEAILPLRRTSQGRLGVEVSGGASSSKSVTVNQNVVVQGLASRQTREQLAIQTAQRQRIAVARA